VNPIVVASETRFAVRKPSSHCRDALRQRGHWRFRVLAPAGPRPWARRAGAGNDRGVVFYPVVVRFLLCVDPDAHQGNEGAVAIVNFMQYEGWEWGKIAAGGTLVMLPVAVFAVFVRHYLVRGLTAGGVKE
jgi:hypothetical protein